MTSTFITSLSFEEDDSTTTKQRGQPGGGEGGDKYGRKPFLPVLIIPGFMSSGLEIKKSSVSKNWEGKRLWINLGSLGFQAMHFGGDRVVGGGNNNEEKDESEQQHMRYKSLWMKHMVLHDDMATEHTGIVVRPLEGLKSVDYLSPGALTNFVSYVFGPTIRALVRVGYTEGVDLDAAPYDWRISPNTLEKRDQYCTNTMKRVEKMYSDNNNTHVVLLCHSLGSKMGHYFLNFCRFKKGQEWIDKHIFCYIPVGGPHLGAPKAIRSVISGDKMGLDAFLTDNEALVLGRSFGSGPWLFPKELPPSVGVTNVIVRQQGVLTIRITGDINLKQLLSDRDASHRPDRAKLMVIFGTKTLSSEFVSLTGSRNNNNTVSFDQESFVFATQASKPIDKSYSNRLLLFICEPGLGAAKKKRDKRERKRGKCCCCICCLKCLFCWCIIYPVLKLLWCFTRTVGEATLQTVDAIAKASGGHSVLAVSKQVDCFSHTPTSANAKVCSETLQITLYHRDQRNWWKSSDKVAKCTVKITWEPWSETLSQHQNNVKGAPIAEMATETPTFRVQNKKIDSRFSAGYSEMSGYDVLLREGLDRVPPLVKQMYDEDPLGPRSLSSVFAPPVKRVKAIFGINLPTEVGAVYKRRKGFVESTQRIKNVFVLDTSAGFSGDYNGYTCENGIINETRDVVYPDSSGEGNTTRRVSGDGTVPYWSLRLPNEWREECDVTINEIEGAEHREILADERFHEILIDYVTRKKDQDDNV